MQQDRLTATARNVVGRLVPAEVSLTEALISNAELTAALGRAKLDNGLALPFGHAIVVDLHHASTAILDAASRTIAAHKKLDLLRGRLGLTETATGSGGAKDDYEQAFSPLPAQIHDAPASVSA